MNRNEHERVSHIETQKKYNNLPIIMSRLIIILVLVNAMLAVALATLFPLKEKIPVFIALKDSTESWVIMNKADETLTSNQALIHKELANYVKAREVITRIVDEDERKYTNIVYPYSSEPVWIEFKKIFESNKNLYEIQGFERKIKILSIVDVSKKVAIVEFALSDYFNEVRNPTPQIFKATIEYRFLKQKVSIDNAQLNPLGIEITNYSLSKVEK